MHALILALLLTPPPTGAVPPLASDNTTASFDALARQANDAQQHQRLDEALDLYRQAVALRPEWDEGWWSIGMITMTRIITPSAPRPSAVCAP
jgi:hypothetical protein